MRYFLNVVTENGLIRDPDGEEFSDIESAVVEAEQIARTLMATELAAGRELPLSWDVQIANARAVVLKQVNFDEILGFQRRPQPIESPVRAAELLRNVRVEVIRARAIKLELRENLARARAELKSLLDLARAFENAQTLGSGVSQSQPGRDRAGEPRVLVVLDDELVALASLFQDRK